MDRSEAQQAVHAEREAIRAYPATLTFHDLIRKNRRQSVLLMWGMVLLTAIVGGIIAAAIGLWTARGGDPATLWPSLVIGVAAGLIFAAIACVWSWFSGANAILRMSGARPISKADDPQLFNVVDELRLAAGLPMPKVYLIDSPAVNAFATGRDPERAAVAITQGLRERLTRDELAGVMAHELAHVRHYDIRFSMLMATLVGLIVFACDAFLRMAFYGGAMGRSRKGGGGAAVILIVIALLLAIIAPLLAKLMQMAISRQREYLADAGAVELTRYPEGLASALRKLAASREPLQTANRAMSHLYIVSPLKNARKKGHNVRTLLSTHPPTEDRIARLMALAR